MAVAISIVPPRSPVHGCFVAALLLATGCGSGGGDTECISDSDCALGFSCTDEMCELDPPLVGRDAGMPTFDAGVRDAGRPTFDAGRPLLDSALPTADGSSPPDGGGTCGVAACAAQGAECGQIIDPCGVLVDCPSTCGTGYSCGTGGFANRCRCTPMSCSELNAQCGSITDNCGIERDCSAETGGCQGSQDRCSNNRCECVPRQCSDVGAQCGDIQTGCGTTRNCGGCTSPQRCGGGGTANQCGCSDRDEVTGWRTFTVAQSTGSGIDWRQLSDGIQFNTQGTNVRMNAPSGGSECDDTAVRTSALLYLRTAGLDVPADATIRGVEVQAHIKRNGTTPYLDELYLWQSSFQSNSKPRERLDLSTGYRSFNFGGPTDRWGLTANQLTPSRVNGSTFGLRLRMESPTLRCSSGGSYPYVDAARVRVYYRVCR